MSAPLYQTLFTPPALWYETNKGDPTVVRFADRHYSRVKRGTNQTGGPGKTLALITPDQQAVWITKWNVGAGNMDGYDAFRCSLFRNEGAALSSTLIMAAMVHTETKWSWASPPAGWITHVDGTKVQSRNPGYCFKKAGWNCIGITARGLLIFQAALVTR